MGDSPGQFLKKCSSARTATNGRSASDFGNRIFRSQRCREARPCSRTETQLRHAVVLRIAHAQPLPQGDLDTGTRLAVGTLNPDAITVEHVYPFFRGATGVIMAISPSRCGNVSKTTPECRPNVGVSTARPRQDVRGVHGWTRDVRPLSCAGDSNEVSGAQRPARACVRVGASRWLVGAPGGQHGEACSRRDPLPADRSDPVQNPRSRSAGDRPQPPRMLQQETPCAGLPHGRLGDNLHKNGRRTVGPHGWCGRAREALVELPVAAGRQKPNNLLWPRMRACGAIRAYVAHFAARDEQPARTPDLFNEHPCPERPSARYAA